MQIVSNPNDAGILSMHSSWSQARPKSASQHRDIEIVNFQIPKKKNFNGISNKIGE